MNNRRHNRHSEKKVNSLRASYRRELQKIRSEKSGAGTDDVYQLSLWYFNDSSFLHDTESSVDGITSFDDGQENETPKASKRRHYESSEFLQKAIAHLDNISAKQPKCEADIYAEGWAAMFKQLSKEQQLFAKKGMDELLMQGRMNMLTYQGVSSIANIPNKININNSQMQCQMPIPVYPRQQIFRASTPLMSDSSSFQSSQSQDINNQIIISENRNVPAASFADLFNNDEYV
ncbi:uncharacterized protein LOC133849724 [Drosophila sulfurigaster albostrigata]|uniref:uncharacterized protein LOC133849724 n=1 Tax=Drosophila sulfurigaster albostrigata TaxID=89887 RepID=UPI002D21CC18|nr:uncharacterized protein LOC133849724 [Drosophila sulfurigaster albostrigata]